ncbi:MAG: SDR family oxidoreductase [Ilumatobacter fluminis]|uniref:SDR family NAD(P)-dependent oxidoreductase n=1 Tax=Ilumatobacter fluminis TaxID=467091 RepID=UPI0032EF6B50
MSRRVLVTDADEFVGPAAVERFRAGGDDVVVRTEPFRSRADTVSFVAEHGPFDVVVANLEASITAASIVDHDDAVVDDLDARLVRPLYWLFSSCLPSMIERGDGAVVVPTSATAIRSSSHPIAGYEAARAHQLQLVRSVGKEMARHGVRVNGIAPNFIENPSYFPPDTVADPEFQASLRTNVPAQRLGSGAEAASVLWWLASPEASYVFGTIVPTDGGWTL